MVKTENRKKRPARQKQKLDRGLNLQPPVHEPFSNGEKQCARDMGISVRSLRAFLASGILPFGQFEEYQEPQTVVNSLAKVATHFGVSERTVATWKSQGMPITDDGKYVLPAIRRWRSQRGEIPASLDWIDTGNRELDSTYASGDLVRGILRWVRTELLIAGQRAVEDFETGLKQVDRSDDEMICALIGTCLARHFEGFRLADSEIEELLVDCWSFI